MVFHTLKYMNTIDADTLFKSGDVADITRLVDYYNNLLNADDSLNQCKNCGLINITNGVQATCACDDGINISFACSNCGQDTIVFIR